MRLWSVYVRICVYCSTSDVCLCVCVWARVGGFSFSFFFFLFSHLQNLRPLKDLWSRGRPVAQSNRLSQSDKQRSVPFNKVTFVMLDLRGASYMHNTRPEHVTVFITLLSSRVPSFFYFDLKTTIFGSCTFLHVEWQCFKMGMCCVTNINMI